MATVKKFFRVDRHEINYLRVIVESYDGMGIVRTIDPYDAIIEIVISPGCEETLLGLLTSIKEKENLRMEPLSKMDNNFKK
jgi:hypothetical protein